ASATWAVDVPPGARLELTAELLPSFLDDGLSTDGAQLEVYADGKRLTSVTITADQPEAVSVAVPAGPISLELRTLPGESALLDHVFLRHPTIQVSGRSPRRLVVIFVDTLRADHLSIEGYGRETTPVLDALAASGIRFRQARSVSPWTLPAAQAALSGRQPEEWSDGRSLTERLSADGWRTIGLVANAYLSPKTGISRGFDEYHLSQLAGADRQVDDALALLEEHAARDVALMVHFMDPHLPYAEPAAFRGLWEGAPPPGLPASFTRDRLSRIAPDRPGFSVGRDYVIARYDQNVRSVDAAVGRLLEAIGEDATAVVFSDHGEEFWDHGGVEHGHSLYDELLRVPLILRAPGLPAGAVIEAPVSLLDVTPTLLSLLGLVVEDGAGVDLLPVIRGEAGAAEALSGRPQALGRLLYGRDQWGAVQGQEKIIRDGEAIASYDLAADPGEQAPGRGDRERLAALLEEPGLSVVPVWRLGRRARTRSAGRAETLTVRIPGGFAAAWGPYDPNGQLNAPALSEDGVVTLAARGSQRRPSEVYLLARQDSAEGFAVEVNGVPLVAEAATEEVLWASGRLRLIEDIAVVPSGEVLSLDPALEEALRLLGYLSD
ncbi:MAG: arylsulfatase A-like enzyme, partial [Myxococcota bacterium]